MSLHITIYSEILDVSGKQCGQWERKSLSLGVQGKIEGDIHFSQGIDEENRLVLVGKDSQVYRVHYDASNDAVIAKATINNGTIGWVHCPKERFESASSITLMNKEAYEEILSSLTSWRLGGKILSFLSKIEEREADAVRREQLVGGGVETRAEADYVHFNQQLLNAYRQKVYEEIVFLVTNRNGGDLREGLVEYLATNWSLVKGTKLSYTALPTHPITEVLIQIAETLGSDDKSAIALLMPGVRVESDTVLYPNLRDISLREVVKTHILNHTQRYLLPVSLCVEKTPKLYEAGGYANPYYDGLEDTHRSDMVITADEWRRLWHHSEWTRALREHKDRYDLIAQNKDTLLGQLTLLCHNFSLYGAYTGMGTGENAAGGVYSVLIEFFNYYALVDETLVPESVRVALERINTQLTDPTSPARQGVQTCIADHRSALLSLIETHKAVLNGITLSGHKKDAAFQKAEEELEAFRQSLNTALSEKAYTGADRLGVTEALLKALNVSLRIDSERDLTLFVFFKPDEMRHLLTESANLREEVLGQLSSMESLVWFLHSLPAGNIRVFFEVLGEALSGRLLTTRRVESVSALLLSLLPEKIRATCEGLHPHLPSLIKHASDFTNVLSYLGSLQRTAVYEAMQAQLPSLIKHAWDFGDVLYNLNPAQRTAVYEAMQAQLPSLIKHASDFTNVLSYLDTEQRTAVYEAMKAQLPSLIKDAWDFRHVLSNLDTEQRTAVYEAMQAQRPSLIKDASDFRHVLSNLDTEQRTAVYEAMQAQLPSLIKDASDFRHVLSYLDTEQRTAVLKTMQAQLPSLIKHAWDFGDVLYNLNPAQCTAVCETMKAQRPSLIKHAWYFRHVLSDLNPAQCTAVCETMQAQRPSLIKNASDFSTVLRYLSAEQCKAVCEAMQAQLPSLIKDAWDFRHVLSNLDTEQRTAVLKTMQSSYKLVDESAFLDCFKAAVQKGTATYIEWQQSKKSTKEGPRGPYGFFTTMRHSDKGITRAKTLQANVSKAKTPEEAQKAVYEFLNSYIRLGGKYNTHSCASFLIEELNKIEYSPWKDSEWSRQVNFIRPAPSLPARESEARASSPR